MNTLWFKAWADLWLYKTRTFLAISSIAIGLFSVGTLFGMIDLLLTKMDETHQQSSPSDINLILRNTINKSWLHQIKQIPGVAVVDSMTQSSLRYRLPSRPEWLTGIIFARPHPEKQLLDKSSLISGHWPLEDQVAIEHMSAQMTGLKPGDTIELETKSGVKSMQISGIVRHPFVKPPKFGGQVHFFIDSIHGEQFGTANELGETMFGIRLDYMFDLYSPVYWFCLICIIAFLASYWPAKKATDISIVECLGH